MRSQLQEIGGFNVLSNQQVQVCGVTVVRENGNLIVLIQVDKLAESENRATSDSNHILQWVYMDTIQKKAKINILIPGRREFVKRRLNQLIWKAKSPILRIQALDKPFLHQLVQTRREDVL